MFETIEKSMLAGLGAISMTRQKAEQLFDEYVSRGKIEKEKKNGFVKDVMDSAEKTRTELERIISEQVKKTVETLNIPTREDLIRIEKKLDELIGKH